MSNVRDFEWLFSSYLAKIRGVAYERELVCDMETKAVPFFPVLVFHLLLKRSAGYFRHNLNKFRSFSRFRISFFLHLQYVVIIL